MKTNKILILLVLSLAMCPGNYCMAQGSGSSRTISDFDVKRTITGKLLEVSSEEQFVTFQDRDGKKFRFYLDKDTKFGADKNTELQKKKDLSVADFRPGQTVKITYRADGKKVFEVQLKKSGPVVAKEAEEEKSKPAQEP